MQYGTVNPALLGLARANVRRQMVKRAFVPGGDPSMMGGDPSMGGGGGMPPGGGGDPSMGGGGGMPPGGDPSMMGGDPSMMGGDPSMMGGGGGMPPGGSDPTAGMGGVTPDIGSMIQQQVQAAMAAQGGGAGGAGGAGMKAPKIDQNVVMLQILKILAKIADQLGIRIPASEMVVTPEDLRAMAQGGPGAAVAQDQAQQDSAIKPIQPMDAAMPAKMGFDQGRALDTRSFRRNGDKAAAIMQVMGRRSLRRAG